jgi:ubiquinone/menaquinone biosynthesis C-methylase UbiE
LYPSITNPSWLVLDRRRRIFERWLSRIPPAGLKVLDVGGRVQPYRPLLAGRVASYVAVDLRRTHLTNVVGSAEQLPFPDNRFDLAICTQVLQYISDPQAAIREISRVLKPGGHLFLSAPSACPSDADEECWRFLPAGLRHLLSPFREIEIVPEGGSVAGLFRTSNICLSIFARYRFVRLLHQYSLSPILNVTGALFDAVSGGRNHQFTANYSVLARK